MINSHFGDEHVIDTILQQVAFLDTQLQAVPIPAPLPPKSTAMPPAVAVSRHSPRQPEIPRSSDTGKWRLLGGKSMRQLAQLKLPL